MPKARKPTALRISEVAEAWVDARAEKHSVSRSAVLRAMLGVAAQHPTEVDAKIIAMNTDVSREERS